LLGGANRQTTHAGGECRGIVGLDQEMNVVGLNRKVGHTKVVAAGAADGGAERIETGLSAEGTAVGACSHRHVDGMRAAVGFAFRVGDAGALEGAWFAPRARSLAAPCWWRRQEELLRLSSRSAFRRRQDFPPSKLFVSLYRHALSVSPRVHRALCHVHRVHHAHHAQSLRDDAGRR
jgi:hypothetical protein